ncbi:hypothetical protein BDD12DRAFT_904652 [Trichophaea hybrida]|nr:hypothetical protein BDD12DRAFT_904652 [Trichophaea hybrida]
MVHSYIWKDPRYGKDCAYRWMACWIGAKCAVTLGARTYGPAISWESFTKAFREEFDPDERECVRPEHLEQLWKDKEQPEQEKLHERRTHFDNDTEEKVAILET